MEQENLFQQFSILAHWAAFDGWLLARQTAGRITKDSSVELYRDMWGSFVKWCATQDPPVPLEGLATDDLIAFQRSREGAAPGSELSPRHAWRLLAFIDAVLRQHDLLHDRDRPAPARDAINAQPPVRYANAANSDAVIQFLSNGEAKELITFLSRARPRLGAAAEGMTWQQLRNRVSIALMLGAGLTPACVRVLKTTDPVVAGGRVAGRPWKLTVPGNGNISAREAPLATWAAELLAHWMKVRDQERVQGDWLFPSTRTGKQWGKLSQYKSVQQIMADAGLPDLQGGSYKLRHTFVLRQLRHGTDAKQVANWLGIDEASLHRRYSNVLFSPPDVI